MKPEPVDKATHHSPVSATLPIMSVLPSPLKSADHTSTQVTSGFQVVQSWLVTLEPLECATHHWPVSFTLPARSRCPSPLKYPSTTSTQVTLGFQVVHNWLVKLLPVDLP